jgi:protein-tyrosine phosphatase
MRIYWINQLPKGKLGMMPRPRGNDWLEDEIKKLKLLNVDCVVSLLEKNEIAELALINEETICKEQQIEFINFPIPDRGTPERRSFKSLVSLLSKKLEETQNIVIHCRMGIGRTSMLCAALLINKNVQSKNEFKYLSQVRTLSVPDTRVQSQWIEEYKDDFKV